MSGSSGCTFAGSLMAIEERMLAMTRYHRRVDALQQPSVLDGGLHARWRYPRHAQNPMGALW